MPIFCVLHLTRGGGALPYVGRYHLSVFSGVILLEGVRGRGMAGCHIEVCSACETCDVGSRGSHKGQVGSRDPLKGLVGSRGQSPRKLLSFLMQEQHFQRQIT